MKMKFVMRADWWWWTDVVKIENLTINCYKCKKLEISKFNTARNIKQVKPQPLKLFCSHSILWNCQLNKNKNKSSKSRVFSFIKMRHTHSLELSDPARPLSLPSASVMESSWTLLTPPLASQTPSTLLNLIEPPVSSVTIKKY